MILRFFKIQDDATAQNIKSLYRDLIKKHHPDVGGSDDDMKQINAEFSFLMQKGLNSFNAKNNNPESAEETKNRRQWQDFKEFSEILQKIIMLNGIIIEIIGSWVWISGQSYLHIEELKKAGFKYSGQKKAWYWYASMDAKRHYKGHFNLNQLRQRHGSCILESDSQKKLTATA